MPPHSPRSFSAFIRKGVEGARAGMGQLPAVSGLVPPKHLPLREAAGPPTPAWARTQLAAEPRSAAAGVPVPAAGPSTTASLPGTEGPQCHRGGVTGRPGCPCPHPLAHQGL